MCTNIRIKAKTGEQFFGRTMDLDIPLFPDNSGYYIPSSITSIPSGTEINSQFSKWKSIYSVMGIGVKNHDMLFDGINECGLVGDLQVLQECGCSKLEYIQNKNKIPIIPEEFVIFILTNYKNVKEIKDNFNKYMLLEQDYVIDGVNYNFPVHFTFIDNSGDGIVIESSEDGTLNVFNYIGVTTNSPRYDYHLTNIRNYIGMSNINRPESKVLPNGDTLQPIESGTGYGLFGIPGDFTSPSRFIRAFCFSNALNEFDKEDGLNELYSTFRSLMVPNGLERNTTNHTVSDYTRYWVGYDMSNRELVVQTGRGLAFTTQTLDKDLKNTKYEDINISLIK